MGILIGLLSFVLVVVCLLLGLLVLIQLPKKEAGMGMAFGSGAVDTLLGAGAGSALTSITKWLGGIFLGLCILLAWLGNMKNGSASAAKAVREAVSRSEAAAPATPAVNALVTPTNASPAASAPAPTAAPAK
ncbi:MAG: preprotein translocase, SecG subunit [Verrucomicrobiota bacterium]|jgi:preprotein translocase subunit SecG|nr:preprotein translocase subunit SecG [Pseudomonadota bacterium]